jgi:hypothetical protein
MSQYAYLFKYIVVGDIGAWSSSSPRASPVAARTLLC